MGLSTPILIESTEGKVYLNASGKSYKATDIVGDYNSLSSDSCGILCKAKYWLENKKNSSSNKADKPENKSSGDGAFGAALMGVFGGVASAATSIISSSIASKQQKEAAKAQEELARQQVIAGVTSGSKNTIALVVIGGVLVIGGLIAVISLKK